MKESPSPSLKPTASGFSKKSARHVSRSGSPVSASSGRSCPTVSSKAGRKAAGVHGWSRAHRWRHRGLHQRRKRLGSQPLMKLLLDTHIWLWSVLEPTRLSKRIAPAIDNRENQLWLSPISVWKLLMLTQKGRGQLNEDAGTWARRTVDQLQLHEAPLTFEVAWKHPRRASATAILRTVSSRLRPKSLI